MKIIYLNFRLMNNDVNDPHSYMNASLVVVKIEPAKTSGLTESRTHGLCDTGAVPYQLN